MLLLMGLLIVSSNKAAATGTSMPKALMVNEQLPGQYFYSNESKFYVSTQLQRNCSCSRSGPRIPVQPGSYAVTRGLVSVNVDPTTMMASNVMRRRWFLPF